ncbi:MAG TPA: coagulation factor 5/8 type domain-containing protein, partial [Solirubrobacteraceae bacterium]|nr:coagulation factor 5/8 type domain-containing protein [Solirubrobacteraceae bacterium]
TTLATTPVSQEQPFLRTGAKGRLSVFVPAVRRNSSGTDWQSGTAGRAIPISDFFVVTPRTSVNAINAALNRRQNLLLTPGVYDLSKSIQVRRANTVVLGLGFPTLVPQKGTAAMVVRGVPGVKLSDAIFDAGPKNSPSLLEIGSRHGQHRSSASDPTLVSDVFFRIGGATPGRATNSLVINSSHVILDDIWAWRADHGNGVGWNQNVGEHGLVVNGSHVTATGLAVEHYEKSQVLWKGERGQDIFFQSEMPYDVPSQSVWMESPTVDGYPSFKVSRDVVRFSGYGMGSYSFFDQGLPIEASMGFQSPDRPGVQFNDLLTRFLNGSGGIESVINGTGAPVNQANPGPSNVTSYP